MITVEPAHGRRDLDAFIEFPFQLYRDDPRWVPPLRRERRKFLRDHPFLEFGSVQPFLARRDGRVVGRIAAVDNPRHNDVHGTHDGFFGLFDCVDDHTVAQALFDTVAKWLAPRGLDAVLGPTSFSTNYECGLLVDGFDQPPMVLTAYNPAYYPALIERCGFTTAKDLWAWEVAPGGTPPDRVARLVEAVRRREGFTLRTADFGDYDAETARLKTIYNSAWESNWGFVPMTDREWNHMAAELKPILRPELLVFAEVDGEPVGFALGLPDANEALRVAAGRTNPLALWRMVRALRAVRAGRLIALGVDRAYRDRGIDAALYTELLRTSHELGYRRREGSWVLEDNHTVNNTMRALGARRTKTYRIYRRTL
ncbi:GNAT family N-acetyltransferase [Saccharothrix deserti]|uniref:GNAT family N-acetyltransferase n=1 Tax=Saccharothrix deserti TaxID=2593674 RepID=UPI00192E641E|nr:GNAT family N-acetyltransferase [Saccharothrix deserti]